MQNTTETTETETPALPLSVLVKSQKREFRKDITYYGKPALIKAEVRYDDQCSNGHNSFAITGSIRGFEVDIGGCIHDEIAKHFPELEPLIKWHLCSADGPMHYIANACYHASARDYKGLLKGEKKQLRKGGVTPVWKMVPRNSRNEVVSIGKWVDSDACPTETVLCKWEPVWIVGEGKAVQLDHARSCAVWPDATDEELTAPGLKDRLLARLPALMQEFKAAVESLGFTY